MSFDQYFSEEKAYKDCLIQVLKGREEQLMDLFIQNGPDGLKHVLNLKRDNDWNIIFDYLVFKKDLLTHCVNKYIYFFKDLVRQKGPGALRKVLGIEAKMYDKVFEKIFDLVAVSEGALYDFVTQNKTDLLDGIKKGQSRGLRKMLALEKKKYDQVWGEVTILLAKSFIEDTLSERVADQGLQSFDYLMNALRQHSSPIL
jgi:hypothetical protein